MASPIRGAFPVEAYIGKDGSENVITVRYNNGRDQVDRVFAGFMIPAHSQLLRAAQVLNPHLRVITLVNRATPPPSDFVEKG